MLFVFVHMCMLVCVLRASVFYGSVCLVCVCAPVRHSSL